RPCRGVVKNFIQSGEVWAIDALSSIAQTSPLWKPHESLDESRGVVKNFIQSGEVWAIEDKASHKVIGSIGLHKREREGYTFDRELGYALSRAFWGRGLMTEAASAIVDYAFAHGVKTLLVAHFDFNDRSRRVIEKLGFGKVGHAA